MSIQVKDIHKQFGSFVALDKVSLEFPTGELVALLGPSGCGKTTLLRIIAGLEQADSGQVLLEGEDASGTHVRERQVGFVFQHYALFRHMTVFDNVAFGMRMKPRAQRPSESQIRTKVHDLLQLVQLDWLADRFPAQLSGGQRQRIALARALAVEPRVLLLDEPFGALDAKVRKELRRWLRNLHDELHITSIFVTHDQEEALEVADRVVLMDHGKVEQIGTPEEVYRHPATPFVYSFLGSVNLFHGRIEDGTVQVGEDVLHDQPDAFRQGAEVIAFARPHELDIVVDGEVGKGVSARVNRVLSFGITARVELDGVNGSSGQHYEVELARSRVTELGLAEGQIVRLVPSRLKLFERQAASPQ
ncbi:sulfate/molybdate ABC transporter ATP-binding protein [Parazoarcus communis]|uniref:Sulfate ABC transporter ATP-binding protein n=1 Tax=Parazoarcus communis SWub3 = DSM 12120 TaxID=1121029 RepID=A0A323UUT1_9RHOO|nr:sulfate ABC transporter ATP-binding protein [Parazoarcus communis]NMG71892.1 sulfate ABC transporter ATP-binding protein [Parazoarcus communis SWub3 = DSM 12120]PZA16309.1 sulfate ABC transporter ATP-binding protein [Azoarcus communis] [Parazoarcus communis SWub3 = DSM 12120]